MQFKRLVQQHQERTNQPQGPGVIATKDLLMVIDAYEHEHDVVLLTQNQKKAIHPYTLITPDLEMTPDDILNLLKLVFTPPSPVASLSAPTSKLSALPRTSAPLKPNSSTTWKRRLSTASMHPTTTTIVDNTTDTTTAFVSCIYLAPFFQKRIYLILFITPFFLPLLGTWPRSWTRAIVSRYNTRGGFKSTADLKNR